MTTEKQVLQHPNALEATINVHHEDHNRVTLASFLDGFRIVLSSYEGFPVVFWNIEWPCDNLDCGLDRSNILRILDEAADFTPIWKFNEEMPFYRGKMPNEVSTGLMSEKAVDSHVGIFPVVDWRYYTVLSSSGQEAMRRLPWGQLEGEFEPGEFPRSLFLGWCANVIAGFKRQLDTLKHGNSDYFLVSDCAFITRDYNTASDINLAAEADDIDIVSDFLVGSTCF